jgi:hypothetical protein
MVAQDQRGYRLDKFPKLPGYSKSAVYQVRLDKAVVERGNAAGRVVGADESARLGDVPVGANGADDDGASGAGAGCDPHRSVAKRMLHGLRKEGRLIVWSNGVDAAVEHCFTGEHGVAWLMANEGLLCNEQCRVTASHCSAAMRRKGALRLGNILRTAGYLHKVQPVLPKNNSVGELRRYPSNLSSLKHTSSLFMPTSTLFCIDINAGDQVSNFRR